MPDPAGRWRGTPAAVLTLSDTRTLETDTGGAYLQAGLQALGLVARREVIREDLGTVTAALQNALASARVVLCTGGSGIAGRDLTPEAVRPHLTQELPGFGELFRMLSYEQVGTRAMLSRACGGVAGETLLFALPGSLNAVQTAWDGILRGELPHLLAELHRDRALSPLPGEIG